MKYSEIKVNPQDDGKNYIVTSGLHVGDRIVLKGITKLTDGQQIKPITLERYNQKIAEAASWLSLRITLMPSLLLWAERSNIMYN